eukprot:COSAG01_NODE_2391_length_7773_cov_102.532056_8_plen_920_part_00
MHKLQIFQSEPARPLADMHGKPPVVANLVDGLAGGVGDNIAASPKAASVAVHAATRVSTPARQQLETEPSLPIAMSHKQLRRLATPRAMTSEGSRLYGVDVGAGTSIAEQETLVRHWADAVAPIGTSSRSDGRHYGRAGRSVGGWIRYDDPAHAAVAIQRMARGMLAKRRVARLWQQRKQLAAQHHAIWAAASRIAAVARGMRARRIIAHRHSMATHIQAGFRGHTARKELLIGGDDARAALGHSSDRFVAVPWGFASTLNAKMDELTAIFDEFDEHGVGTLEPSQARRLARSLALPASTVDAVLEMLAADAEVEPVGAGESALRYDVFEFSALIAAALQSPSPESALQPGESLMNLQPGFIGEWEGLVQALGKPYELRSDEQLTLVLDCATGENAGFSWFQSLPTRVHRRCIARYLRGGLCTRCRVLFQPGDSADTMYFVVTGAVRIMGDGEPIVAEAGTVVGDLASSEPGTLRQQTAEVDAGSVLMALDRREWLWSTLSVVEVEQTAMCRLLASVPAFALVPPGVLALAARALHNHPVSFGDGSILAQQGQVPSQLLLLTSGAATLQLASDSSAEALSDWNNAVAVLQCRSELVGEGLLLLDPATTAAPPGTAEAAAVHDVVAHETTMVARGAVAGYAIGCAELQRWLLGHAHACVPGIGAVVRRVRSERRALHRLKKPLPAPSCDDPTEGGAVRHKLLSGQLEQIGVAPSQSTVLPPQSMASSARGGRPATVAATNHPAAAAAQKSAPWQPLAPSAFGRSGPLQRQPSAGIQQQLPSAQLLPVGQQVPLPTRLRVPHWTPPGEALARSREGGSDVAPPTPPTPAAAATSPRRALSWRGGRQASPSSPRSLPSVNSFTRTFRSARRSDARDDTRRRGGGAAAAPGHQSDRADVPAVAGEAGAGCTPGVVPFFAVHVG